MKGKFAHISDCHIGVWRDPRLRELNDRAFEKAIELAIKSQVDFVIISGDIFDIGIPEMTSVRSAVRKLRELADQNIPAYVVYGSHDYSPTTVSVVDVLTSAGLFVNVGEFSDTNKGKISLKPVIDEKTGVKIAGLPARKRGIEASFYKELEKEARGEENTKRIFSIFVFHASVNELQSLNIPADQNVSIEELPSGFSYYAGGHLHKRSKGNLDGAPVVYPGPLFGTSYLDLEMSAKGENRGFAIVEFNDRKVSKIDFLELDLPKILAKTFSGENKTTELLRSEIHDFVSKESLDVKGSIILLKVRGVLSSGKPTDIDWYRYRVELFKRGALVVNVNRMGLSSHVSRNLTSLKVTSKEEIESTLLERRIRDFKTQVPELTELSSGKGISKASDLLKALKTEKRSEETKQTFEKRIWKEAVQILGVPEEDEQTREGWLPA